MTAGISRDGYAYDSEAGVNSEEPEGDRQIGFPWVENGPQQTCALTVDINGGNIRRLPDGWAQDPENNDLVTKSFAYGTYPTEKERQQIVSQFKEEILNKLK